MMTLHSILSPIARAVRAFRKDESATLSVELVMIFPLLVYGYAALFTYFDVYRAKNAALKANYAVSDLLSRETSPINMSYLLGAEKVYQYLTGSDEGSWLRVSVVRCHRYCTKDDVDAGRTRDLRRDWSNATDGMRTFSNRDIQRNFDDIIPWIAEGERVIIVESGVGYKPAISSKFTGIGERNFNDIIMTRPRFAPQLCWEGIGCGN